MILVTIIICTIATTIAQQDDSNTTVSPRNSVNTSLLEARGGYGGGGYGGGGYGGGYGSHGHGGHSISMDPVSILGLLSLGAVLLRSILSVLTSSARSLDVSDINLPLQLSDIPEAIANWQDKVESHVVYERSIEDEPSRSALNTVLIYETLLGTERRCLPNFLCTLWKSRAKHEDSIVDILFLATAGLMGESDSAVIYDNFKKPDFEGRNDNYCEKAKASCPEKLS